MLTVSKDKEDLDDEVLVYLKINECSELDQTVVKLLEANKINEAIEVKRRIVDSLQEIAPRDKVGFAKVLLLRARIGCSICNS